MSGEGKKTVAVTGASGFIASWLVKFLLQRAYTVKATVRDPNDPKKTAHLLALDGAKERLQLFKAELMEEGSFDPVVDGCEAVFHTAAPTFLTLPTDPQAELIDPAIKGTLNVLRSCARVDSIKRVVLTSSMAAVVFNGRPLTPENVVDETWFSDPSLCQNLKLWYMLSKTLAEEAAWKFAEENRLDMVTMHPGLVIGPLLQPNLNSSVEVILDIVYGRKSLFGTIYRFVDVRDVAVAHIKAYEIPSARGRYCLVNRILTLKETLKILHELYPNSNLPEKCEDVNPDEPNFQISQEKAKSLGIDFTPVEITLKDTVDSLREKGLLSI